MDRDQMTRRESLHVRLRRRRLRVLVQPRPFRAADQGHVGRRAARKLAAAFDPFGVDVPIAPVLQPVRRSAKLDEYAITMKEGSAQILPGIETPIIGYEGTFPGPTIRAPQRPCRARDADERARRGARRAPARWDDAAGLRWPPGARDPARRRQRVYRLPERAAGRDALVPQPRARQHGPHGLPGARRRSTCSTTTTSSTLDLPRGKYDVPLMIADRSFNADGSFRYRFDVEPGFRGDTILVNGAISPRMRVERRLLPAALPQRVERAPLRARARQRAQDDSRSPPTAGCCRRRWRAR